MTHALQSLLDLSPPSVWLCAIFESSPPLNLSPAHDGLLSTADRLRAGKLPGPPGGILGGVPEFGGPWLRQNTQPDRCLRTVSAEAGVGGMGGNTPPQSSYICLAPANHTLVIPYSVCKPQGEGYDAPSLTDEATEGQKDLNGLRPPCCCQFTRSLVLPAILFQIPVSVQSKCIACHLKQHQII